MWEKMLRLCKIFPVSKHQEARGFGFFFFLCSRGREGRRNMSPILRKELLLFQREKVQNFPTAIPV